MLEKNIWWLTNIFASINLLGTIVSVCAFYGVVGIYVSIIMMITAFSLLITCLFYFRPVLQKNDRGVTLLQAINNAGMVDIEIREDKLTPFPPYQFFKNAKHEIVISGISASRIFEVHIGVIQECLNSGNKVHVLLSHPDSGALNEFLQNENKDKLVEIRKVISDIKLAKLHEHPGFKLRFHKKLPTFTYLMIDGDLDPTGDHPRDEGGQIRVQSVCFHPAHHRRIVLQFRKKKNALSDGAFEYYAEDLRIQWKSSEQDDSVFSKL